VKLLSEESAEKGRNKRTEPRHHVPLLVGNGDEAGVDEVAVMKLNSFSESRMHARRIKG
jgi:hypothetical protein